MPTFALGTLIKIVAALAVVALCAFLVVHFENVGKAKQKEIDQPIIDGLQTRLKVSLAEERQRQAETAQCVAASKVQSQAIADQAKAATDAQAASAALIAKAQAAARLNAEKIAALQAFASSAPKTQTCEKTLSDADAIARESARTRRK